MSHSNNSNNNSRSRIKVIVIGVIVSCMTLTSCIEAVTVEDIQEFCAHPPSLNQSNTKGDDVESRKTRRVQSFITFLERRFNFEYGILGRIQGDDAEVLLVEDGFKDVSKIELFDHATEVAMISCPNWLVSHDFLKLVRELFSSLIMELKPQGSKKDNGLISSLWKVVNFEASRCKQRLNSSVDFQTIVRDAFTLMSDDPPFEPSYFKGKVRGGGGSGGGELNSEKNHWTFNSEKNAVIETAWLVANHVAAVCHALSTETYNFWPNFVRVFSQVYLKPLEKEWNDPSQNEDYKFLLGGYDYQVEYEKLGFCATQAFKLTLNLLPFHKDYNASASTTDYQVSPWDAGRTPKLSPTLLLSA